MKINKKEFNNLIEKANLKLKVDENKITDLPKYMYWATKSEQFSEKMVQYANIDKPKYHNCLHESLLCEVEKNKYCYISKKELTVLYFLLKYHNAVHPDKIFVNNKGLKIEVLASDRRAVGFISSSRR